MIHVPFTSVRSRLPALAAWCTVTLLAGCASAHGPAIDTDADDDRDLLCEAMKQFAEAVPAGRHEVTLLTDWSLEPGRACRRVDEPAEKEFCAYLIEGTSIEFMGANVERALKCAGVKTRHSHDYFLYGGKSGSYRTRTPAFTKRRILWEIDFDNTSAKGLPHLTIAVTPLAKE